MNALTLSKSEYYSPTPTLKVNREGRLADFNIAARVLIDSNSNLGRFRHQPLAELDTTSSFPIKHDFIRRLVHASLGMAAPDDSSNVDALNEAKIITSDCQIITREFGAADIHCIATNLLNQDSGDVIGTTIFLEIRKIQHESNFRNILRHEWDQQLTWETYAASYDRVLPCLPFYQDVVQRHIEAFSDPRYAEILDVGAGTGNVAIPLSQKSRKVTAVDSSRAMLDKLRAKLSQADRSNISIIEQNAEDLSQWKDETFHGVNILLALFDMSQPSIALTEAMRVLRSQGLLVVTEPKHTFNMQMLLDFADKFLRDSGMDEQLIADWQRVTQVNKTIDPSLRSPLWIDDIEQQLTEKHFFLIKKEDSHLGNCATVWATKSRAK